MDQNAGNKSITYVIKLDNPEGTSGVEDIFDPIVTLDFADMSADMISNGCAATVADVQTATTLPADWSWDSPTSTSATYDPADGTHPTWSTASGVNNSLYDETFVVDFDGCTDISDTFDITLTRDGTNMSPLTYDYLVNIEIAPFCGDNIINQDTEVCDGTDDSLCVGTEVCNASCSACEEPGG